VIQSSASVKLVGLAIVAAGTFLSSTPVHAVPVLQTRCSGDVLTASMARARLEWARSCGLRINVVSPTSPVPPASLSTVGGVTEYFETNDFFGRNSYSGSSADVNGTYVRMQWRAGAFTLSTDENGFQKWTKPLPLALSSPLYPTYGNNADIGVSIPLFPNPNYALHDCRLYRDAAGTQLADTSNTGFFVNGFCTGSEAVARCADGTQEQLFPGGMVGCAGAVTFANRNTLCAPGSRTASAAEWTARRGGIAPTHNYWTRDDLKYSGAGPSACAVSPTTGNSCGTTPMRVCTALGTDAEGNQCNWQHCGLETNTPDQFFGGCAGNTNAGALCIINGCADGTIEQTFAGGMVGCAASEGFGNRSLNCGPGFRVATAAEWVALRSGIAPTHNYWTNDALNWGGSGPSACFVSTTAGNTSCGASPMRVCTASGTDPEGNRCNWTHCGLDANAPDQFFGGCAADAGVLCIPVP
jgi:hypothetical protein